MLRFTRLRHVGQRADGHHASKKCQRHFLIRVTEEQARSVTLDKYINTPILNNTSKGLTRTVLRFTPPGEQ